MPKNKYLFAPLSNLFLFAMIFSAVFSAGCGVEAARVDEKSKTGAAATTDLPPAAGKTSRTKGATIEIAANSPADTVRVFYKHLREKKLRDAIFLTNLRPAIEGLTDAELKELEVDFEPLARAVPAEIEINGEIIPGNYAVVTARLPDNESKNLALQEIRLRKEGDYWIILTVDETAEDQIKKEGNKYFFNLRLETYQSEAKSMLERVSKAQMVHAIQNGGLYGEMKALVELGLLPDDIQTAASTGYQYKIVVAPDKKSYYATAEPISYGKSGRLSYLLELDGRKNARLTSKDNQGQPLKK